MSVMTQEKNSPDKDRHKTKPFSLRLPVELRKKLKVIAKDNYRTLTAEMLAALVDHVNRHDQSSKDTA